MSDGDLRGERVVLRPVVADDVPRLREILVEPSVARWWGLPGASDVAEEWLDASDTVSLTIVADGVVVGSIQYAEETDPDYRHAGIDLFLDTAHQGLGLGRDSVRTLARHLFEVRGHHRLTIDPAADNERAIRAYTAVGFRPVGIMRAYERGPDGTFHDGMLLEMLSEQLS